MRWTAPSRSAARPSYGRSEAERQRVNRVSRPEPQREAASAQSGDGGRGLSDDGWAVASGSRCHGRHQADRRGPSRHGAEPGPDEASGAFVRPRVEGIRAEDRVEARRFCINCLTHEGLGLIGIERDAPEEPRP
jgi:hypothetical protein